MWWPILNKMMYYIWWCMALWLNITITLIDFYSMIGFWIILVRWWPRLLRKSRPEEQLSGYILTMLYKKLVCLCIWRVSESQCRCVWCMRLPTYPYLYLQSRAFAFAFAYVTACQTDTDSLPKWQLNFLIVNSKLLSGTCL